MLSLAMAEPEHESAKAKVQKRALGKTEMQVSEVALGLWGLTGAYGPVTEMVFEETVKAALKAGVNLFDVAPLWGDSETRLGALVKETRDDVRIMTRAGAQWTDNTLQHRFNIDALEADCEASLKALDTDWVDVWMLHDPGEDVVLDDKVVELAQRLKAEGMIRAFGVTTSRTDVARAAILKGADVLCMPVHMLHSDDAVDLEFDLEESGTGFIARSPLSHGLLTGRWTEYRRFASDDHRSLRWTKESLRTRVRTVNALRYLVHDDVPNLAAAALRYVLGVKGVSAVILGARRAAQIENAAKMAGKPPYLPDEDLTRLGQVLAAAGA